MLMGAMGICFGVWSMDELRGSDVYLLFVEKHACVLVVV